ncbi:hypothetical protein ACGFY7_40150 [Streptomyces prunicolor]|uniref:RraA family protein n=1 Tax=Streptomyces prunicolor TaxID=67348 RepID=UPI003714CD3D
MRAIEVRDTYRLRELGFPAFSASVSILGTGKSCPGRVGSPVQLRGHRVARGNLIVADADGIAVLPAAETRRVRGAARARAAKEDQYLARLRDGALTLDLYGFRELGQPEDHR